MMKRWVGILFSAMFLLPSLAHAGFAGLYKMDNKYLIEQVKKRWNTKIPKEEVKKMISGMKKMKAKMLLTTDSKFRGVANIPGQKKESVEEGTWKKLQKGKKVMVYITIVKTKKKKKKVSVMKCVSQGASLYCKGEKSPIHIKFDKVS